MAVRLNPEILRRLADAVKKTGISNKTALIKICVFSFLDYFERTGLAGLPLNWEEIIHELDGRSQRYNNINVVAHPSVVNGGVINNHPPSSRKRSGKPRRKR